MGVDMSMTIGVGFAVDTATVKAYGKERIVRWEDYAPEEYLEHLLQGNQDGLTFGAAGSYWSGDVTYYIAVRRLTQHYDEYDMPSGLVGFGKAVITLNERQALRFTARTLGMIEDPVIGQFVGILYS